MDSLSSATFIGEVGFSGESRLAVPGPVRNSSVHVPHHQLSIRVEVYIQDLGICQKVIIGHEVQIHEGFF